MHQFSSTQWRSFVHLFECPLLTSLFFCFKWLRKQVHLWKAELFCLPMCSEQGNSNTMTPCMGVYSASWRWVFVSHTERSQCPIGLRLPTFAYCLLHLQDMLTYLCHRLKEIYKKCLYTMNTFYNHAKSLYIRRQRQKENGEVKMFILMRQS